MEEVERAHQAGGVLRDCKDSGVTGAREIEEIGVLGWSQWQANAAQAPRLGLLSGRSLGKLGRRSPPPCPPPPCSPRNPKRGRAPCQGGRGARPAQVGQLPTQMVPMCSPWPDSLPANSHRDSVVAPAGLRVGVWSPWVPGGGGPVLPMLELGPGRAHPFLTGGF